MMICDYTEPRLDELIPLYASVGWTSYTDHPERLEAAYRQSLTVLAAWEDHELLGVIRAVGDGVSILFVQDLLVYPQHQRKGVGSALMRTLLARYPHVHQTELLTDKTEKTNAFYRSLGFQAAKEAGCISFIKLG